MARAGHELRWLSMPLLAPPLLFQGATRLRQWRQWKLYA
jgi:hypothetical protein